MSLPPDPLGGWWVALLIVVLLLLFWGTREIKAVRIVIRPLKLTRERKQLAIKYEMHQSRCDGPR